MRRAPYTVVLLALASAMAAGPARAQREGRTLTPGQLMRDYRAGKLPPGSFIRRPVVSVDELVDQLQTDPLVAARYARLFNMSPEAVRLSFKNLRRTTLAHDEIMRVYYVHGDVEGYKLRRLKAGEPIFALPDGSPALVLVCGNPLRSTLLPPALALQVPDFNPLEEVEVPATSFPPALAERPGEVPQPFPFGPPPPGPVVGMVTPGFVEEEGRAPAAAVSHANFTPLLLLPLLALIHTGSNNSFPVPPPGPVPVPAVPEPGACALLACAAAGFAAHRRTVVRELLHRVSRR